MLALVGMSSFAAIFAMSLWSRASSISEFLVGTGMALFLGIISAITLALLIAIVSKIDSNAKHAGEQAAAWGEKMRRRTVAILRKHSAMMLFMICLQWLLAKMGMQHITTGSLHKLIWTVYAVAMEPDP